MAYANHQSPDEVAEVLQPGNVVGVLGIDAEVLNSGNQLLVDAQRFEVLFKVLQQGLVHAVQVGTLVVSQLAIELARAAMDLVVLSETEVGDGALTIS